MRDDILVHSRIMVTSCHVRRCKVFTVDTASTRSLRINNLTVTPPYTNFVQLAVNKDFITLIYYDFFHCDCGKVLINKAGRNYIKALPKYV